MFHVDNYSVNFSHTSGEFPVPGNPEYKKRKVTFVAIRDTNKDDLPEEGGNLLGLFWVVKYYKDQDSKDKARKYALDKALKVIFPGKENKELRARFWETYFKKQEKDRIRSKEQENK